MFASEIDINTEYRMDNTFHETILNSNLKAKIFMPIINELRSKFNENTESEMRIFISALTGLNAEEIQLIQTKTCQSRSTLTLQARITLMSFLKSLYEKANSVPTFTNLYKMCKASQVLNKTFIDMQKFLTEMKILHFDLVETIDGDKIIMEDPKFKFERQLYFQKINEHRSLKKYIIYIDERIIDKSLSFKKPYKTELECDQSVFFHAANEQGLIACLMTNQLSELNKWILDVLLQDLDKSVIVMDRNPIHDDRIHKTKITRYHNKSDMIKWLSDHNIPHNKQMAKPELYEIIRKSKQFHEEDYNKLDKILKAYGHEVLRLPHNFQDLSITNFFWQKFSKQSDKYVNNVQYMTFMKEYMETEFVMWKACNMELQKAERRIINFDKEIDEALEKYKIKL